MLFVFQTTSNPALDFCEDVWAFGYAFGEFKDKLHPREFKLKEKKKSFSMRKLFNETDQKVSHSKLSKLQVYFRN